MVHYIRYWTRLVTWPKLKFLKFKTAAAAASLKNGFLAITYQPIVRFQRNFVWWNRTACRQGQQDKTLQILKIQDGGRPPFWKSLNHHISVKSRTILMKFCTPHQIFHMITVTDQKLKFLKFNIATATIFKIAFLTITYQVIVQF